MEFFSASSYLLLITMTCFVTVFSQQTNRRQGTQSNCVTPDNYYGVCTTISYCPQVASLLQYRQYLLGLQRSCGTRSIQGDPVVCCTNPVQNPTTPSWQTTTNRNIRNPVTPVQTTRTTTTTTTLPPPTASTASLIDNKADSCRGPDTRPGVCIDLKNCKILVDELRTKQTDVTFANFLRVSNQICQRIDSNVCCPTSESTSTSSPISVPTSDEIPRRLPTEQEGCGYNKHFYRKIVGGEVSTKGAWPWIALIGYDDELATSPFKCGGTLITRRHVLTAAHCIRNDLTFVRLGEHDLTTNTEAEHVDVRVIRSEPHREYNKRNGRSDIAILYLERNVKTSDFINPICLPQTPTLRQKSYIKHTPFVVGWGKTLEGGKSATVLQELQIPIYDNMVCKNLYQKQKRLFSDDQFDSAVICAGELSGGKDTCQGDSGGPLMIPESINGDNRYYLIGVVSYGIGCARPDIPGVYTSTQYFMDWITEKVADT